MAENIDKTYEGFELTDDVLKNVNGGGALEDIKMEYVLYEKRGGTLDITQWLQRGRPSR